MKTELIKPFWRSRYLDFYWAH